MTKKGEGTITAIALLAVSAFLMLKHLHGLKPKSDVQAAVQPSDAANPWNQVLMGGGLPQYGPQYWGANAPITDASQINVNVDPDYLAALGMSYLPLFGFVGISTPEVVQR